MSKTLLVVVAVLFGCMFSSTKALSPHSAAAATTLPSNFRQTHFSSAVPAVSGCFLAISAGPGYTVAPHGGFDLTVGNGQPGVQYTVKFVENGILYHSEVFTMPSSGFQTYFENVDDIFGASSPLATSGQFTVTAGTTTAIVPPGETCSPASGITITVTSPCVGNATNLAPNPSFEDGLTLPDCWNFYIIRRDTNMTGPGTGTLDSSVAHTGLRSFAMNVGGVATASDPYVDNQANLLAANPIPVDPAQCYSLSAWAESSSTIDTALGLFVFEQAAGGAFVGTKGEYLPLTSSGAWELYNTNFTLDAGSTSIQIVLVTSVRSVGGTSLVRWDDVALSSCATSGGQPQLIGLTSTPTANMDDCYVVVAHIANPGSSAQAVSFSIGQDATYFGFSVGAPRQVSAPQDTLSLCSGSSPGTSVSGMQLIASVTLPPGDSNIEFRVRNHWQWIPKQNTGKQVGEYVLGLVPGIFAKVASGALSIQDAVNEVFDFSNAALSAEFAYSPSSGLSGSSSATTSLSVQHWKIESFRQSLRDLMAAPWCDIVDAVGGGLIGPGANCSAALLTSTILDYKAAEDPDLSIATVSVPPPPPSGVAGLLSPGLPQSIGTDFLNAVQDAKAGSESMARYAGAIQLENASDQLLQLDAARTDYVQELAQLGQAAANMRALIGATGPATPAQVQAYRSELEQGFPPEVAQAFEPLGLDTASQSFLIQQTLSLLDDPNAVQLPPFEIFSNAVKPIIRGVGDELGVLMKARSDAAIAAGQDITPVDPLEVAQCEANVSALRGEIVDGYLATSTLASIKALVSATDARITATNNWTALGQCYLDASALLGSAESDSWFEYLPQGAFVVGDESVVVGRSAAIWGASWWKLNKLSGGLAPAAFKGFASAVSSSPPSCGGTFTADPGNSSNPPAQIPLYMAVVVSNKIAQSGATISGGVQEIVIVRTDSEYSPDPGGVGTGTVMAVFCRD